MIDSEELTEGLEGDKGDLPTTLFQISTLAHFIF